MMQLMSTELLNVRVYKHSMAYDYYTRVYVLLELETNFLKLLEILLLGRYLYYL